MSPRLGEVTYGFERITFPGDLVWADTSRWATTEKDCLLTNVDSKKVFLLKSFSKKSKERYQNLSDAEITLYKRANIKRI